MMNIKKINSINLFGTLALLAGCGAGDGGTGSSSSSTNNSSSSITISSSSVSSSSAKSSSLTSSSSISSTSSSTSSNSSSSNSSVSSDVSTSSSSSSVAADSTPADFNFVPQTNIESNSWITSNTVTISDINVAIPVTISGGEYSINGGAFSASEATISNNQTLSVRVKSSETEAQQTTATLMLAGTISKKFTVTTNSSPLKIVRLEAENFIKSGGASAFADNNASEDSALGSLNQTSNGFQFLVTQKTEKLRFAYRTPINTFVNVSVNSTTAETLSFESTGSQVNYGEIEINKKLAKGDSLNFAFASGGDLTLDYVELIPSAFQVVSTLAKAAGFNGDGLTIDKNGNVFVGTSKGATVKRVTPNGEISLFASFPSGTSANGSDFDSKGNLYVANEAGNIIHKITPDGIVTDFATGLDGPAGIYIDENDNLIVGLYGALSTSPGAKVIKITPDQIITTLASGNGLTNVVGVAGDGQGRYFAANFKTGEIFEVTNGDVKQIGAAGTRVNHIKYAGGYIYMPNPLDNVVRRIDLNGNIELVAGAKFGANSLDGPRLLATFARPNSIDISSDGKTLYILDFNTGDVRTITMGQ